MHAASPFFESCCCLQTLNRFKHNRRTPKNKRDYFQCLKIKLETQSFSSKYLLEFFVYSKSTPLEYLRCSRNRVSKALSSKYFFPEDIEDRAASLSTGSLAPRLYLFPQPQPGHAHTPPDPGCVSFQYCRPTLGTEHKHNSSISQLCRPSAVLHLALRNNLDHRARIVPLIEWAAPYDAG